MPPALRRRAANTSTTINATITASGTHQLAAAQSIQDPDSAGAAAGFFCTTGAGARTGAGADVLSEGGSGVGVDTAGAGGEAAAGTD